MKVIEISYINELGFMISHKCRFINFSISQKHKLRNYNVKSDFPILANYFSRVKLAIIDRLNLLYL